MTKHCRLPAIVAVSLMLGILLSPIGASAASISRINSPFDSYADVVTRIHDYREQRSCGYWRSKCGHHKFYSDYNRCMKKHGCTNRVRVHQRWRSRDQRSPEIVEERTRDEKPRYEDGSDRECRMVRSDCAWKWGSSGRDFRGCMRKSGCTSENDGYRGKYRPEDFRAYK